MEPSTKKLLNSLACPICGCQIDLISSTFGYRDFNYSCVADIEHYTISLMYGLDVTVLDKERVIIYDDNHKYEVSKYHYYDALLSKKVLTDTFIKQFQVDPENRVIDNVPVKTSEFKTEVINTAKVGKDKLLNRVKTLLVFQ